jgi:nucleoside-diphosphate-sugar epimerase
MLLVSEPVLGLDEKDALAAVIESGWVTMGDRVREALLADCTSFANATGWSPQVPPRRGLERTVDWWRGRLSAKQVRREQDFIT